MELSSTGLPTGGPVLHYEVNRASRRPTRVELVPTKVLLKDLLFNRAKVEQLAGELAAVHPAFRQADFVREVVRRFPELELKARIAWIAEVLRSHLPPRYPDAVALILRALPAPNDPTLGDDDFGDFIYAAYNEFVAVNGCSRPHLDVSLNALHALTQRFSAEDAIRAFLNAFPEETMRAVAKWSRDPHYHVRRLCSEGTRPRLPWSRSIGLGADDTIPVLDRLFADRTRFVTRSVANHLNDISRLQPALVVKTLRRWRASGKQSPDEMAFIIRHALRTLVKAGDDRAMALMGISPGAAVRVSDVKVSARVQLDSALEFSFTLRAAAPGDAIVDYAITFAGPSGRPAAKAGRKVFKLKRLALAGNTAVRVAKRHPMRSGMTTRTLHRGKHHLAIQVNGRVVAERQFRLV